jgi:hypothetical protein
MSDKRSFLQYIEYGLEKFGEAICDFGDLLKKNKHWAFELRKVVMAIPVVVAMLSLADECRQRLPEMVGIHLLTNGDFERMIARETAISASIAITSICLVFMFLSRKTIYPWLISLMSLLLPILLIVTNIFPA